MRRRMMLEQGGLPAQPYQVFDYTLAPASYTIYGVTWTNNNDGTFSMNGTNTSSGTATMAAYRNVTTSGINGHTLLLYGSPSPSASTYNMFVSDNISGQSDSASGYGLKTWQSTEITLRLRCAGGYTANNVVFTPQLIDLTATYGAGNEPTTLAEFKADYPLDYYPYNPI